MFTHASRLSCCWMVGAPKIISSSSLSRRIDVNILLLRWKSTLAATPPSSQQSKQNNLNINNHNRLTNTGSRRLRRHRLDVAIVGAPNAGKSQLLNVMLQQKVAAVSRKRHTTRGGIFGVRTVLEHNTQLVFVDTPGFVKSIHRIAADSSKKQDPDIVFELSSAAIAEMEAVDYSLLVIDAARALGPLDPDAYNPYRDALIALMIRATIAKGRQRLVQSDTSTNNKPLLRETFGIVLNKVDLVHPKTKLLDLSEQIGMWADQVMIKYEERMLALLSDESIPSSSPSKTLPNLETQHDSSSSSPPEWEKVYPEFFYTSALHDNGVDDIMEHLISIATPCGKPLYNPDVDTDDDDSDDDDEFDDDWLVPPSTDDSADGPSTSSFRSPVEQVEEIIREKLYRCLHREVPHHVQQVNRMFRYASVPKGTANIPPKSTATRTIYSKYSSSSPRTRPGSTNVSALNNTSATSATSASSSPAVQKVLYIEQDLIVYTKSHQRLVMGRRGSTLQRIQGTAVPDLEENFNCKVVLKLHVKYSASRQVRARESEMEGVEIDYVDNDEE